MKNIWTLQSITESNNTVSEISLEYGTMLHLLLEAFWTSIMIVFVFGRQEKIVYPSLIVTAEKKWGYFATAV